MDLDPLNIDELREEAQRLTQPTAAQRRALYRLYRTKAFIRRFARTKEEAHAVIAAAIEEMQKAKRK